MRSSTEGTTLAELVVVVALLAMALAVALPTLAGVRGRASAAAAARSLAVTFHAQRWRSLAYGASHGLRFDRDDRGWLWYEVRDGNGNGLRSREIANGTDPTLSGPHRLAASAQLGLPPTGPFPEIPPGRGRIDESLDPIRFGRSDLLSFGPLGTSSSGRVYVTDGRSELFAVVLFGQTGRARVWRYDGNQERWTR